METETDTPTDVAPEPTCTLIPAGTGGLQPGRQQQSYFEGISSRSAGSRGICMHLVLIPPAAQTAAHLHAGHETAIYVLSGSAETWYGPGLEERLVAREGDFLYIPAGMPHLARNLSSSEPCRVLVARTDPDEQESVVLLPQLEPDRQAA
jgi:uncharacterized RmlC-like cupin family protein